MSLSPQSQSPPPLPYQWESSDHPSGNFPFMIRTARQPDLGGLADILTHSFYGQERGLSWLLPLLRLGIYEDLRHRFFANAPRYIFLVAIDCTLKPDMKLSLRHADCLVGTVELGLRSPPFWQTNGKQHLYISNLAVRSDYRRRGVGQRLLTACEQVALDWGFPDLYLHVLEDNQNAQQLYEKMGYRLESIDFSFSAFLFKRPRQIFLHKRLT